MTREIAAQSMALRLKTQQLHSMASTWMDLIERNNGELEGSPSLVQLERGLPAAPFRAVASLIQLQSLALYSDQGKQRCVWEQHGGRRGCR